jgi:hypothetical protein
VQKRGGGEKDVIPLDLTPAVTNLVLTYIKYAHGVSWETAARRKLLVVPHDVDIGAAIKRDCIEKVGLSADSNILRRSVDTLMQLTDMILAGDEALGGDALRRLDTSLAIKQMMDHDLDLSINVYAQGLNRLWSNARRYARVVDFLPLSAGCLAAVAQACAESDSDGPDSFIALKVYLCAGVRIGRNWFPNHLARTNTTALRTLHAQHCADVDAALPRNARRTARASRADAELTLRARGVGMPSLNTADWALARISPVVRGGGGDAPVAMAPVFGLNAATARRMGRPWSDGAAGYNTYRHRIGGDGIEAALASAPRLQEPVEGLVAPTASRNAYDDALSASDAGGVCAKPL